MRLTILLILIIISIPNISCDEKKVETSDSNIFPKKNEKYYRRTEEQLIAIWEFIDSSSNDDKWLSKEKHILKGICEKGLVNRPEREYCACAIDFLEKKVEAKFLLSHSVRTLAFMLGRTSAEHCQ